MTMRVRLREDLLDARMVDGELCIAMPRAGRHSDHDWLVMEPDIAAALVNKVYPPQPAVGVIVQDAQGEPWMRRPGESSGNLWRTINPIRGALDWYDLCDNQTEPLKVIAVPSTDDEAGEPGGTERLSPLNLKVTVRWDDL